jgi:small subunit ribosomal protein S1
LTHVEAIETVRQTLREDGWCRLVDDERFYINVGWDYYVYVGTDRPCDESVELAESLGLFVDRDFASPYMRDDD